MKTLIREPQALPQTEAQARRTLLLLHASADLYGSDRTLLQLCQGLADEFHCVVALPRRGPLVEALEAAGVTVETGELGVGGRRDASFFGLLKHALKIPRAVRFVRRLAKKYKPELCHTNTLVVVGGALGAKTLGIPHVLHVHEIVADSPRVARMLARIAGFTASRIVCNSSATAEALCSAKSSLRSKLQVVHNGSEPLSCSEPQAAALREEAGLPAYAPVVALVGRINSWKGHALLVEAAMLLQGRFPHARFLFVGDAPAGQEKFEVELRKLIEQAGLQKMFHHLPFRSDIAPAFAAADIVCVPSTRPEPFGLVALEAMSLSRSVIAADHGGLAEIVRDGVSGALVEPNNPRVLAEALAARLANPALTRAEGRMGRAIAEEHFALSVYVNRFRELYRSDCAQGAAQ
ncbi:MAG: glycosyltransferase [Planctomycetota bacterium]